MKFHVLPAPLNLPFVVLHKLFKLLFCPKFRLWKATRWTLWRTSVGIAILSASWQIPLQVRRLPPSVLVFWHLQQKTFLERRCVDIGWRYLNELRTDNRQWSAVLAKCQLSWSRFVDILEFYIWIKIHFCSALSWFSHIMAIEFDAVL